MKVADLLTNLSHGELSNLSMGNEGRGSINEADIPKVMGHVNSALLAIYSRFVLMEKDVIIECVRHITNYHLIPKFAETTGSDEPWPYIKDLPEEPFIDDVIKILKVTGSNGHEFKLNDKDDPNSLFTNKTQTLQVPRPVHGMGLAVTYQARHPLLEIEGEDVLGQFIMVPFVLESALQAHVAYKIFSHMNGQENQIKGQEYLVAYDTQCIDVETRDLVNATFSTSHTKLEDRGFI